MKAPDKIYLQELSDGTWDDCFVYESSETDTNGKKRVPYIRKDALLKWISETRAIPREYATIRDLAFQEIVNYLNTM